MYETSCHTCASLRLLNGGIWLLALTNTIVAPLIIAALIASVAGPGVTWLQGHSIPRAGGTALILLAIVLIGVLIAVLVIGGVTGQAGDISEHLKSATSKLAGDLKEDSLLEEWKQAMAEYRRSIEEDPETL